ncbi:MAG: heme lyase CcmF/NrfE family subunit [Gammaproteobacteria bacterium]|nr:heme lyase CcmF/NrfE family subunit [Gammaproteobacteria bacterium]
MIVELGHFATILALGIAAGLAVVGYLSATRRNWARSATVLAAAQLLAVASGFAALLYAFLTSDFSVLYVTENSNTALPWYYKLSAAWGGHEGSFLLWTLMLAAWTWAVSIAGRRVPAEIHGRVLGTLGLLNAGFLLFLLSVSSPFERLIGGPAEGSDLNPLLQDFGQIVHPPMLYLGYVGFAVAFAFAVAALLARRLDAVWARWTRPWANVAWAFLTVGIALGSWWAYYELGWGGWWFWDPVENASFMPWLAGTALIHSLAVTEKRGAFKSWTVFLAIAAFSLSLLGAFIVRSGVLTSVHAFAVDPERGLYLLAFVVLAVGGALTLYGLRAPAIRARAHYWGLSRELMLLCNNLVLVLALAVILIYTLYPLAYEAVTAGEKTSIGPPYYNRVFVPLALALAAVLAVMPVSRWRRTPVVLFRNIGVMLVIALALGVLLPLVLGGAIAIGAMLAVGLGLWIAMTHVTDFRRRRRSLTRSYLGMVIAHLGFAISVVGVGVTSEFSHAVDARMTIGDSVKLNDVEYRLNRVERVEGPNYTADRVEFTTDTGVALYPEKRHYPARNQVMTEAGIAPGFLGDLYITLGEQLPDGSWGVRINDKPLVRWVWLGALLMAFGGILAVTDARYRRLSRRQSLPSRAVSGEPAVT